MRWSGLVNNVVSSLRFFNDRDSVMGTKRAFRNHFQLGRRASVPSWYLILRWVDSLRAQDQNWRKNPPGRPKTVRSPVNIEEVSDSGRNLADNTSFNRGVMRNFRRRLNPCINTQGYRMEDVIFYKKTALSCEFEGNNESLIGWSFKTFFCLWNPSVFLAYSV